MLARVRKISCCLMQRFTFWQGGHQNSLAGVSSIIISFNALRFSSLLLRRDSIWISNPDRLVKSILQLTFPENGMKMSSHLHISKFEILSFSNKIHKNCDFFACSVHYTLLLNWKNYEIFCFMDFIKETKNFKFWNVELGCHFCSFLINSHV